jgi:hypothetical protein
MTSMADTSQRRRVVIGVDTHKHIHVAVALDELDGRIAARSFAADRSGHEQLIDWALDLGREVVLRCRGNRLAWRWAGPSDPPPPASACWRCYAPTAVIDACGGSLTP